MQCKSLIIEEEEGDVIYVMYIYTVHTCVKVTFMKKSPPLPTPKARMCSGED